MSNEVFGRKFNMGHRRYSDSCLATGMRQVDDVDNPRVPPFHNELTRNTTKNVWENKIKNEEKLNSLRKMDIGDEEIEDDWFTKLTNENELWFKRSSAGDVYNLGPDSSANLIPLLPGKELHLKEKTMKTLRVGIKKIWKRGSATITEADPTYKVSYLGNVVTGWAKGEGCVEKPLSTTWKNYTSSTKPDVHMKVTITHSGLKAVTKEYGLTEYWSNRITYCSAPAAYPRVFCWIYRHEGRKLKQELRCHSVLCSKESDARNMAVTLRLRLTQALSEFKRDKILRQNARLSLANSVYDNPSLPRRKILLSTGSHVYKPPLEKSKSAPKLMAIEESVEEDDVKNNGESEEEEEKMSERDDQDVTVRLLDRNDTKLSNLSFVKKLCSSIENLVENTHVYGKKFLSERKSKEVKIEERKKPILVSKSSENLDEEGLEYVKTRKKRKSVTFEDEKVEETAEVEFTKCTDYRKENVILEETSKDLEENEEIMAEETNETVCDNNVANAADNPVVEVEILDRPVVDVETDKKPLPMSNELGLVMLPSFRDSDSSDDSTNSLQSISSCSSDMSTDVPVTTQEKRFTFEEQTLRRQYLDKLLSESFEDVFKTEEKVVLHPTGGKTRTTGINPNKKYVRSFTFPQGENEKYSEVVEFDSLSEEDEIKDDDEVVSDESGYVELAENTIKRLSLDIKEKDIPYHQIIKSNALRPRPIQSSCLEV